MSYLMGNDEILEMWLPGEFCPRGDEYPHYFSSDSSPSFQGTQATFGIKFLTLPLVPRMMTIQVRQMLLVAFSGCTNR